ncbi:MAG: TRASH domain-containing protein [Planctomycetes bacterium]|nr:TRASH domain-containing protein [Planctomycetota bacterium]
MPSSEGQDRGAAGKADQKASAAAKEREKADIAAQKICLVSGKSLGSMGAPIKVTVKDQLKNDQDAYVCCKGCVAKVKKEPEKYLANLRYNGARLAQKRDEKAWKAQGKCPVMDEEFGGEMGTPWVVNVKRRDVFVCCKGCIAKLQKDPEKYLVKLPTKDGKTMK